MWFNIWWAWMNKHWPVKVRKEQLGQWYQWFTVNQINKWQCTQWTEILQSFFHTWAALMFVASVFVVILTGVWIKLKANSCRFWSAQTCFYMLYMCCVFSQYKYLIHNTSLLIYCFVIYIYIYIYIRVIHYCCLSYKRGSVYWYSQVF